MTGEEQKAAAFSRWRTSAAVGERQTVSYLVRFWLEPREEEGEAAPFRGYARDLSTGEECHFEDPTGFAEHIMRQLRAQRREQALRGEPEAAERSIG